MINGDFGINSWSHSYGECGHSYSLLAEEFGVISTTKNESDRIYSKEEWMEKIQKKGFNTIDMEGKFLDLQPLDQLFSLRGVNEEKAPFDIREVKSIRLERDSPFMEYKYTTDPTAPWLLIRCGRRRGSCDPVRLGNSDISYPISHKKYDDIQDLVSSQLPTSFHSFFQALPKRSDAMTADVDELPTRFSHLSV